MKYTAINVKTIKQEAIMPAIDAIELDPRNYNCTSVQWHSCAVDVELYKGAKAKIASLLNKLDCGNS